MLTRLSIRDYALIDRLDIEFGGGFNVITGETGAGKSIVIGAFSLLLGERADTGDIRSGKEKAVVQGTFSLEASKTLRARLADLGLDSSEPELSVRREISQEGKSRCFVNDMACPLSTLKALGNLIADMHGQNEHQAIYNPETHLPFIDSFGRHEKLVAPYQASFAELSSLKNTLAGILKQEKAIQEKKAFLEFQKQELEKAGLRSGREQELLSKIKYSESGRKVHDLLSDICSNLDGETLQSLSRAAKELQQLSEMDNALKSNADALTESVVSIKDTLNELGRRNAKERGPELNLDELNADLAALSRLKRKYGKDEEGLLELLTESRDQLAFLGNSPIEVEELERKISKVQKQAEQEAAALSQARKASAKKFDRKIRELLGQMNMMQAVFRTEFIELPELSASGSDNAEFKVSFNPGEPEKPLTKIASGGEISRVMLAIKSVLAESDGIPVLVFDEIDTGIGGETSGRIGTLLKELSAYHQVFCITHSHQIAKEADSHFSVAKSVEAGRTTVSIRKLVEKERVNEIARMLGGGKGASFEHAKTLVKGTA